MDIYRDLRDNQWEYFENKNKLFRYIVRRRYQLILEFIKKVKPDAILDVGCGDGVLEYSIKKQSLSPKIIGVDISRPNLIVAKSKIEKVNFIQADAKKLPFKDRSFDMVICSEVLEHIHNHQDCLDELARLTSTHLIITTPNAFSWKIFKYSLKYPFIGLTKIIRGLKSGYFDDSYYGKAHLHRYFFIGYLKKIMKDRGFKIIDMQVTSFWDSIFRHLPSFFFPVLINLDKSLKKTKFGYCLFIVGKKD